MRSTADIGAPKRMTCGPPWRGRYWASSFHIRRKRERLPSRSVLVGEGSGLCEYHSTTGEHQCPYQSQNHYCVLHGAVILPIHLKPLLFKRHYSLLCRGPGTLSSGSYIVRSKYGAARAG